MGLMQVHVYFYFIVNSVLNSEPGIHLLPIVVYLDNIVMYGDTQKLVLEDMFEEIKWLAAARFMPKLHKNQLVQAVVQVLRPIQSLGFFWAPKITKPTALMKKNDI